MTFTYNADLVAAKDRVRFLTGDKDPADPQVQDEEVTYLLAANNGNEVAAAIDAVEGIVAMKAQLATISMDAVEWEASDIFKQFMQLLEVLRARLARRGGVRPYAGGLFESDKQIQELNPDAMRPFFVRTRKGALEREPWTLLG